MQYILNNVLALEIPLLLDAIFVFNEEEGPSSSKQSNKFHLVLLGSLDNYLSFTCFYWIFRDFNITYVKNSWILFWCLSSWV